MNSEKKPGSPDTENCEPAVEGKEPDVEDWVPLSVRKAREMPKNLWPHLWLSFASMIILFVTLAILAYRMGAQSCH